MKNSDPYQHAWHELETGTVDKALWARAFAEADGDEKKAKAAYIRFRVVALTNEPREKAQQKAAEIARLSSELIKDRAEILRRLTFLELNYPPANERLRSAVNSLSNTQAVRDNEPDKFIRAVVALDAALGATPSLKRDFFGTSSGPKSAYLSDIVSKWRSKLSGPVSRKGDTAGGSVNASDALSIEPAPDVAGQQVLGAKQFVSGVSGNLRQSHETSSDGFFAKLANGDYGLAKTYWLFGVLVDVIVSILAPIIIIESAGALAILVLVYTAYEIPVLMGVWRAANRYAGPKAWAVLAKVAVVLGALMLALMLGVGLLAVIGLLRG